MDYVQRKNDPFDTQMLLIYYLSDFKQGNACSTLETKHLNNILKKVLSVFKVCSKDTQPN